MVGFMLLHFLVLDWVDSACLATSTLSWSPGGEAQQPFCVSCTGGELHLNEEVDSETRDNYLSSAAAENQCFLIHPPLMLQPLPSVGFFHPAVWPLATFVLTGVFESL